jgi:hypothetical protein
MSSAVLLTDQIHLQAVEISHRYKRAETELIEIIQKVDKHQVFIKRGHSSLYFYLTRELGLSENIAYALITVARKCTEVPELQSLLEAGDITMSNARRVATVLNSDRPNENSDWLKKASELSNRQLEKEIVRVYPQKATVERASYVTPERIKLQLGLSEREMLRLRRVQDLLSQSLRRAVNLEEAIGRLTSEFINRHDPVEKAKRHRVRNPAPVVEKTKASVVSESELDEIAKEFVEDGAHDGDVSTNGVNATGVNATDVPVDRVHEKDVKANGTYGGKANERGSVPADIAGGLDESARQSLSVSVGKLVTLRIESQREPIAAALLHQVNFRDQQRCTHQFPDGSRCNQSRWLEIHHRIPVSEGGENTFDNLTTLCSAHHRFRHLKNS